MSNSTSDYNTNVRDDLPSGMIYDSTVNRYQINDHSFPTYKLAKWYHDYLVKFGYVSYSVNELSPSTVLDFDGAFYIEAYRSVQGLDPSLSLIPADGYYGLAE